MNGVVEGAHMGHPDFRVHGKIFATLHPDQQWGMVKLTPEQQRRFVREVPATFTPEKGAWGAGLHRGSAGGGRRGSCRRGDDPRMAEHPGRACIGAAEGEAPDPQVGRAQAVLLSTL
jgi:hypothetical protein